MDMGVSRRLFPSEKEGKTLLRTDCLMYSIGIELSPKEFRAGLVSLGDKPQLEAVTFAAKGEDKLATIAGLCSGLTADAGLTAADIAYVGIAAGNKLVGTKCCGCNLDFTDLVKYFPVERVLTVRKTTAKAIAEETLTYGRGYSFAYIDLNETVGFGLLIDGKPYVGGNGLASDIAHTTIVRGGRKCSCGNNGCFEAYCNLDAFMNTDRDEYVSLLACGITNVMNLFQPNVIVVGGKVAQLGSDELFSAFSEIVHTENYARNSEHKTLLALPTIGENAALLGAALLGA